MNYSKYNCSGTHEPEDKLTIFHPGYALLKNFGMSSAHRAGLQHKFFFMLSESRLGQPHQLLQLLVDLLGFFHSKPCEETNMGFRWLLFEQCRMERDDIVEQCILTCSLHY
jgi:hypothetical protein